MTEDGHLRFLGAPPGHRFPVAKASPDRPDETARAFLSANRELLGATSTAVEFEVTRQKQLPTGGPNVRLQQTYRGIPVVAAEIITNLDDTGGVTSMVSDILTDTRLLDTGAVSLTPGLTADAARVSIRETLAREAPGAVVEIGEAGLKILAPSVLDLPGDVRLVWKARVSSSDKPELAADVFVDAQTGEIVQRFSRYHTALDREIYDANNTSLLPGVLVRDEGDPPSGLADADLAYQFLGETYNFYASEHGRDGLDDSGGTLLATVRWCSPDTTIACPLGNAFWDGTRMKFGQGYAVDDVTGHELTHGVTENESGLVYQNTSGAINEAFSDIWGEFIDLRNSSGNDAANVRWLIAEDIPGGAIRDMADPTNGNDPDRLGSPFYVNPVVTPTVGNDFGGVHSNSGIVNKLAYLLTDGDTFNERSIRGMGISRVADLFYQAQVAHLTSSPGWDDFAGAVLQSAVDLGWNEGDLKNVLCALVAVELIDDAEPPMLAIDDPNPTFDPPNPWAQEGVVIQTLTITAGEGTDLHNIRFTAEALQCFDVPCETDHVKKIHHDNIEFVPPHIAYLPGDESMDIEVKFTVPIGQAACVYSGNLIAIADVNGACQDQFMVTQAVELEVLPLVDMDIDDDYANLTHNVMHLKGAKDTSVQGSFTVVNPNSWDQNVDFPDGPGNIRIDPVGASLPSLVKVGDPAVWIPSTDLQIILTPSLGSGEAGNAVLQVTIPDGIPVNAYYRGTVTVTYAKCDDPNEEVSDSFDVELHVLPTQGTLDIIQTGISGDFCPDDPWTAVGHVTMSFDVHANGDHRNIRVASGGLLHETLATKLDEFNFYPEEIAFLAAGETRTITVITKIPIGQDSGNYTDYFRVVSENAGEDSVEASIDICEIYDMDIKDDYANLEGNRMMISALSRANQSGGEWTLRAFDIGLPARLVENHDEYDGPGNTPIDCIECEFAPWSPMWHEEDPAHNFHSNFLFTGEGTVIDAPNCDWGSGEFKRMLVSLFVPPMKKGENHPGNYRGRLDCYAIADDDTVASDSFDIEIELARIVGPAYEKPEATFGGDPISFGTEVYWGDFRSVGIADPVNLYRQSPESGVYERVNTSPLPQNSSYVDTDVVPGETYSYKLGVRRNGEEILIGPVSIGGNPRNFRLSQNAPNPFSGQTTIAFDLPEAGHVSLKVFDLSGRLVRSLKNEEEVAGFHQVIWNRRDDAGRESPNGIYFYRLDTPGFSQTKKMLILKQ